MSPRLEPVRVSLSVEEASVLVAIARRYEDTLRNKGGRLAFPVRELVEALDNATTAPTDASVGMAASDDDNVGISVHEFCTPGDAAGILGCSESNARDLVRRGVIPGRRYRGRWLLDLRAVHERAGYIESLDRNAWLTP